MAQPVDPGSHSVTDAIRAAVGRVEDPEIPVTLADLGVLRSVELDAGEVRVVLRTTRLACPGRQRMAADIEQAVAGVASGRPVVIEWDLAPWRSEDATETGRQALHDFGYALAGDSVPACPYCGAGGSRPEGLWGGSPCKVPFTCRRCGSPFDALAGSLACATPIRGVSGATPDSGLTPVELTVRTEPHSNEDNHS